MEALRNPGCVRRLGRAGSRALALLRVVGGLAVVTAFEGMARPSSWRRRWPPRLRRALERLGLTYLKLGQYLALRYDIVPQSLVEELGRLFESVSELDFETVRRVVESELGASLESLFARFTETPTASASVAQVHRARLHDGREVAVKVQRPGIRRRFAADMRVLGVLARLGDALGLLRTLSLREALAEFERFTGRELSFLVEGRTAERLRRDARCGEIIPWVHRRLTTDRVLTLDFIEGVSLGAILRARAEGGSAGGPGGALARDALDSGEVLRRLSFATLHQLFITGFFHGDPHPGNILITPAGRVAFVDFGICGELTEEARARFARYTGNLAIGRVAESFRHLREIYRPTEKSDPVAFRRDAVATLREWYAASRSSTADDRRAAHIGRSFDRMVVVVHRHHYRASMEFLLFWRTLILLDAIALRLDPAFDLTDVIAAFFARHRGLGATRTRPLVDGVAGATAARAAVSGVEAAARGPLGLGGRYGDARWVLDEAPSRSRISVFGTGLLVAPILGVSVGVALQGYGPRGVLVAVLLSVGMLVLQLRRFAS